MIEKLASKKYFTFLLFVISFIIFSANIWGVSIYIIDESRNASCAREMFEKNELIVPTFNYDLRTDKPPLHYFFMMLSYSIFGVNALAARLFSALFGSLTIFITFLYTKKFFNKKVAFWSATVLLSSIHLAVQSHFAVPDPYLIFFFTWSLFLFYSALKTNKLSDKLLLYVALSLAVLSKGPVSIALPGLIFLIFLIADKKFNLKTILKLKPLTGAFIVLAISTPWFWLVHSKTNGAFTEGFFLNHNLNRFASPMEGHGGFFLITFLFVLAGLFPFSLFIFQAIKLWWKNRKISFLTFSAIAGITITIFFSISGTKLPNYTVPAYPFFAVILGYYLSKITQIKTHVKPSLIVFTILAILIPIGGFIGMKYDESLKDANNIAWWFLSLPIGAIVAWYFFRKQKTIHSLLSISATAILTSLIFFYFVFPVIDNQNPVKNSLHLLENKKVVYFEKYCHSYSFYLKKPIPAIQEDKFEEFFEANKNGIIITTKNKIKEIDLPSNCKIVFSQKDVFESPTTVLIGSSNE